jgi:hypothetical protein
MLFLRTTICILICVLRGTYSFLVWGIKCLLTIAVVWDVVPCSMSCMYRHFRGTCCHHHNDKHFFFIRLPRCWTHVYFETSMRVCQTTWRRIPEDIFKVTTVITSDLARYLFCLIMFASKTNFCTVCYYEWSGWFYLTL